jgi:hypothetical protein
MDEVMEFKLALADRSMFDLAPGTNRWVDIALADSLPDGEHFGFFGPIPIRLLQMGFGGPGSYSFKIVATADNANAVKMRINWHWDGTVSGLGIRPWWWPCYASTRGVVGYCAGKIASLFRPPASSVQSVPTEHPNGGSS